MTVDFEEVEKNAINYITYFLGRKYVNKDNIDFMTSSLLLSMTKYDETKGAKMETYLYKKAQWTCMAIKKKVAKTFSRKKVFSLDANTEDGRGYYDIIADDKPVDSHDLFDKLMSSKFLSDMDRDIVRMVYVEDKTLKECAEKHGISFQRVAQRLNKVEDNFKHCYKSRQHLTEISGE